ncbi:MAG TPA: T9SS type A sorting domain-containing protein [Chitinophagales bacterium]|nr:T9SS type A sorting domain-containing protein [Chitinophagales bacterium]
MKKVYLFFVLAAAISAASAQCTIDPQARTTAGISPSPDSLPCVIRSQAFDQTIQVMCPTYFDSVIDLGITSYPIQVTVDSMELDSVIGLPSGITWVKNPNLLYGGQNGCLTFSGTTTSPTGVYRLLWYGTVWGTLPSPIPAQYAAQTYTGVLNKMPWFDYYLNVINQGDPCVPASVQTGIKGVNADLNAIVNVYPNPNNGVFEVKVNAGSRINGQIAVVDMTGRTVYSQQIDIIGLYNTSIDLTRFAKGLYTLQVKSASGITSKNISVE